jgi:hypothetical protein
MTSDLVDGRSGSRTGGDYLRGICHCVCSDRQPIYSTLCRIDVGFEPAEIPTYLVLDTQIYRPQSPKETWNFADYMSCISTNSIRDVDVETRKDVYEGCLRLRDRRRPFPRLDHVRLVWSFMNRAPPISMVCTMTKQAPSLLWLPHGILIAVIRTIRNPATF